MRAPTEGGGGLPSGRCYRVGQRFGSLLALIRSRGCWCPVSPMAFYKPPQPRGVSKREGRATPREERGTLTQNRSRDSRGSCRLGCRPATGRGKPTSFFRTCIVRRGSARYKAAPTSSDCPCGNSMELGPEAVRCYFFHKACALGLVTSCSTRFPFRFRRCSAAAAWAVGHCERIKKGYKG